MIWAVLKNNETLMMYFNSRCYFCVLFFWYCLCFMLIYHCLLFQVMVHIKYQLAKNTGQRSFAMKCIELVNLKLFLFMGNFLYNIILTNLRKVYCKLWTKFQFLFMNKNTTFNNNDWIQYFHTTYPICTIINQNHLTGFKKL